MLALQNPPPVPIRINDDGVALIGQTRVRLETVIIAFHQGDSPEQIVDSYDVLTLADVYAVIAYYLNNRDEIDTYIRQREAQANAIKREIEADRPEIFTLRNRLKGEKLLHTRAQM